jgi:hypothetical protein
VGHEDVLSLAMGCGLLPFGAMRMAGRRVRVCAKVAAPRGGSHAAPTHLAGAGSLPTGSLLARLHRDTGGVFP